MPSLSLELEFRPHLTLSENCTVGRHPRFCKAYCAFQLQLNADNLLHAFALKVSVFRSKRCLRVDTRNAGVDRLRWVGVQVNTRRLAETNTADLPFWHETAEINRVEIQHRNDRHTGAYDFARFGGARRDDPAEWRMNSQVRARGFGFSNTRLCLFDFGLRAIRIGPLLRDLFSDSGRARAPNAWVLRGCLRCC